MTLQLSQLNYSGLSKQVIEEYSRTPKVKQMLLDIQKGDILPPIEVYKQTTNNLYTIADGIHRTVSYILLNISSFKAKTV